MEAMTEDILARVGRPADAGDRFADSAAELLERLRRCEWSAVPDDRSVFTESPAALVYWAPVIDSLKALDDEIVRNSVTFRWQEVRRELRRRLDVAAVLASGPRS